MLVGETFVYLMKVEWEGAYQSFLFISLFLFFQTQAFPFMGYLHFERGCALVHIKSFVEGDGIFTRLSAFL